MNAAKTPNGLPTIPPYTSPEYRLLAILVCRRSIDQRDWLRLRAGWRLADSVHRVRKLGWNVQTKLVRLRPRVQIASYSLDETQQKLFAAIDRCDVSDVDEGHRANSTAPLGDNPRSQEGVL